MLILCKIAVYTLYLQNVNTSVFRSFFAGAHVVETPWYDTSLNGLKPATRGFIRRIQTCATTSQQIAMTGAGAILSRGLSWPLLFPFPGAALSSWGSGFAEMTAGTGARLACHRDRGHTSRSSMLFSVSEERTGARDCCATTAGLAKTPWPGLRLRFDSRQTCRTW